MAEKGWLCARCERRFGRAHQPHVCEPALPVDVFFADRPPALRRAYDAVVRHLEKVGPVHIEAVGVGVLIKRARTFAEVRPKRDRLVLSLLLSRLVEHPRIAKTIRTSARRVAHFVDLRRAADVDRDVRRWLAEAYACSPV